MPTSSAPLRTVSQGEPVSAEQWNRVVAILNRLTNISAGAGLELTETENGLSINLAPRQAVQIPATIESVNAGGPSGLPSAATYDVRAVNRPDIPVLPAMVPKYGRPTIDDESHVHYAQPGDLCYLIPKASANGFGYDLEVKTEVCQFTDCDDL